MFLAIDCRMIGSGGIGTYFESVLSYLLKNFDCLLFGNKEIINKYTDANSIFDCQIKTFSLKELFNFPKDLLSQINKCDFYYTPYCNVPGGIKIPVFTTIHDVVFLDVPGLSSKAGTLARKYFYQRAINKSKSIFTVSDFSAERITKHLSLHKKPLVVTYNSVPEWFKNDSPAVQKEDFIIFVGNIKKHKGLHTLLKAFKSAKENGLSSKLLIIGNSANFRTGDDSIISEINSFPQDFISFTGKVSDQELKDIYKKAKLLVQPSLYEGFGMPPLEALTMGTNVIISDIPVFKEIYKSFPVTFFECENSQDLCEKLLSEINKPSPVNLPQVYSFEKTSKIIIETILNSKGM